MGNDGHGSTYARFKLGVGDGDALRAVIDAIAHRDLVGDDITTGHRDLRTMDQRRADTLIDLTGAYQTLIDGLGTADLLDSADHITAQQARLLACDADILPIVGNGHSQPLDVGRQQRLFGGALRQALAVRDRGCCFPGCDKPPRDCDAHHIIPWWHHGETTLTNGALLCRYHHQHVEPRDTHSVTQQHLRWVMRMSPDGYPELIPPARLPPTTTPPRTLPHPPIDTENEPCRSPGAIQRPCSRSSGYSCLQRWSSEAWSPTCRTTFPRPVDGSVTQTAAGSGFNVIVGLGAWTWWRPLLHR